MSSKKRVKGITNYGKPFFYIEDDDSKSQVSDNDNTTEYTILFAIHSWQPKRWEACVGIN